MPVDPEYFNKAMCILLLFVPALAFLGTFLFYTVDNLQQLSRL